MITNVQPLSAGNAARLFITPPSGASFWRVLRRTSDAFTGATDTGAVMVADNSTDNAVLDITGLVNGTPYFWRDYSWNGSTWIDSGASIQGTPAATYAGDLNDPHHLVRERVAAGLAVEIARGTLKPKTGKIPVLIAPFAMAEHLTLPAVSVHMDTTGPSDRFIGESLYPEVADLSGTSISDTDGWLARMTLAVVGVSHNADERIALRGALRRVIQANLGVFDHAGMLQIELQQNDTEEFGESNAVLYYTRGTMNFVYPAFINDAVGVIEDVSVTADVTDTIL